MNKVSIIAIDNCVVIDGVGHFVDCSMLDPTVHAIQWSAERGRGHVEFVDEDPDDGKRPPNQSIDSIAPYQALIDAWATADQKVREPVDQAAPGGSRVIG